MRKSITTMVLLALLSLLAACGDPSSQWATHPPEGAKLVPAPEFKVGDTWVWKKHRRGAADPYVNWEEKVIDVFNNGDFVILRTDLNTGKSDKLIYDKNRTAIGIIHPENNKKYRLKQVSPTLNFPLWIGKRWSYDNTGRPYAGGHIYNWHLEHVVTEYERVETEIGTYDGVKIVRYTTLPSEGRSGTTADSWYVPELKCIPKFYMAGAIEQELVKFTPGE